jgi:hypothetical protein
MHRFPTMLRFLPLVLAAGTADTLRAADAPAEAKMDPAGLEFFEKNVRPIFTERCYECHSKEKGFSKGGLIMDSRAGLLAGGDQGPAVVPGDVKKSLLIVAVHQTDPELSMPPRKAGAKLTAAQIDVLERWVKMGAPAPVGAGGAKLTGLSDKARSHWAFQPVRDVVVPTKLSNPSWCQNEIDAFVLAKLDEKGLKPSPVADGEALLRRLSYDLIGLPPTSVEVDAFSREYDSALSMDAVAMRKGQPARAVAAVVERTVDRLLASPHYGERWARHWLDTARYSDTKGLKRNGTIETFEASWTYRDYVIDAFNSDKPYDQFIIEQLAADRLPDLVKDDPRLAALGFVTVGKRFQNNDDTIDERIDATTKGFLGLTVACSRCHDHKFDPIPAADYYSLHGIFSSVIEPQQNPVIRDPLLVGKNAPTNAYRADYEKKLAELIAKTASGYYRHVAGMQAAFHREFAPRALATLVGGFRSTAGFDILKKYDLGQSRELDPSFGGSLGRLDHPITGPLVRLKKLTPDNFEKQAPAIIEAALADKKSPVNPLVADALRGLKPKSIDEVALAYQALFKKHHDKIVAHIQMRSQPGRKGDKDDPSLAQLAAFPWPLPNVEELSTVVLLERVTESRDFCEPWQVPISATFVNNNKPAKYFHFGEINALDITHPGGPGTAMVITDVEKPRDSYVYIRGDRNKRGPVAPRQFLEVLAGPDRLPFYEGSGRRELALAIASRTNPLTSRVLVNRLWLHHFGAGIVTTPDDFGNMSEAPSHPELLDWMATAFVEGGWSIKKMHKRILVSATYRQSANPNNNPMMAQKSGIDPMKIDASNKLLWHANLRRLDFESIRDSMLLLSGKLDRALGGRAVNITDEPYSYRRTIYGFIDRDKLSEFQSQFDFADPNMANSVRGSTIVPQQALFFMNNPLAVEVARNVTARPELAKATSDDERITQLYRIMYQRSPTVQERQIAREFVTRIAGYIDEPAAPASPKLDKVAKARADKLARQKAAQAAQAATTKGPTPPEVKLETSVQGGKIVNNTEKVDRKVPTNPWVMLAQSMVCSNEFVYLN